MKRITLKYKNFLPVMAVVCLAIMSACVDEDFHIEQYPDYNPALDPEMAVVALSIFPDGISATRSDDPSSMVDNNNGLVFGDDIEHKIDFETHKNNPDFHESYAIFFKEGPSGAEPVAQFLSPLYLNSQLGEGTENTGKDNVEFSVPVVTYLPKKELYKEKVENGEVVIDENGEPVLDLDHPSIIQVLVVLNGGKMYDKIKEKFEKGVKEENGVKTYTSKLSDYLYLTWDKRPDHQDRDNLIGRNAKGLFTMTNTVYYSEDPGTGMPMTKVHVAEISPAGIYSSIDDYMKLETEHRTPAAQIAVERMVAKFLEPTFSTEVIGSVRVFRPDEFALPINIYKWKERPEDDTNFKEDYEYDSRSWRIHLLGWTINGNENKSYLFKNLPDDNNFITKPWWNDASNRRSYWSVDPHYDGTADDEFYPWQVRKAADLDFTVSKEFGAFNEKVSFLQYFSFEDIDWRYEPLYVQENTFDPDGPWYNAQKEIAENSTSTGGSTTPLVGTPNELYLDNRASILAANHLLITAELYLERKDGEDPGEYLEGKYGTVADLWGDRTHKYYLTEKDCFKMFVKNFNDAIDAQEMMSFNVLNWDKGNSDNSDKWNSDALGQKIEGKLIVEAKGGYRLYYDGVLLTNKIIDEIYDNHANELGYIISDKYSNEAQSDQAKANVKNGDGRLIPWLRPGLYNPYLPDDDDRKGLTVRSTEVDDNGNYPIIKYYREGADVDDSGDVIDDEKKNNWTRNMFKSLFYEWFGPIDHFKNGFMYYAGEILNQTIDESIGHNYYGTVRNHQYRFNIQSINALGIPVDEPSQVIIPERHAYKDELGSRLIILDWHQKNTDVKFE